MGDMHDTFERMHLQAWNEIIKFIAEIADREIPIYYIVGNHDMVNNQVFMTDDHFFNAFKYWGDSVKVIDSPDFIPFGDGVGCVGFLPYVPPGRFMEACQALAKQTKPHGKCRMIFAHQEFKGASFGPLVSTKGDEWPDEGCLVVSGHIHEHSWLKKNLLYVGTPYQTNFGESDDKSISLITLSGKEITEERIRLNIPKKLIIQTNPKDFENIPFNDFDTFKVFVTGTSEEIAALKKTKKYKEVDKRAQVVLKPTDKSMVKKNIDNLGYMDLVHKEIEKEPETVRVVFKEAIDEAKTK